MISTAIGGSFLLAAMCFFLYKRKKNKQAQKNVVPNPGREEGMVIPTKGSYNQGQEKIPSNLPQNRSNHVSADNVVYNHGQEILQIPENESRPNNESIYNKVYNHGREAIPIANDEKLSLKNIDYDVLQHLKNEMVQTLKQEIMQNL